MIIINCLSLYHVKCDFMFTTQMTTSVTKDLLTLTHAHLLIYICVCLYVYKYLLMLNKIININVNKFIINDK